MSPWFWESMRQTAANETRLARESPSSFWMVEQWEAKMKAMNLSHTHIHHFHRLYRFHFTAFIHFMASSSHKNLEHNLWGTPKKKHIRGLFVLSAFLSQMSVIFVRIEAYLCVEPKCRLVGFSLVFVGISTVYWSWNPNFQFVLWLPSWRFLHSKHSMLESENIQFDANILQTLGKKNEEKDK